jgi:hypothetical protein
MVDMKTASPKIEPCRNDIIMISLKVAHISTKIRHCHEMFRFLEKTKKKSQKFAKEKSIWGIFIVLFKMVKFFLSCTYTPFMYCQQVENVRIILLKALFFYYCQFWAFISPNPIPSKPLFV